MHSEQQHSDTRRKQEEPDKVESVVYVFDDFRRFGLDYLAFWDLAEEDQDGDNSARRKVDVETKSPCQGPNI